MAFSFVKAFLAAFKPASAKAGPALEEYYQQLPEPTPAQVQQEAENDFLLSEWEKEERREQQRAIPEARPVSPEEAFLEGGQWAFASRSAHVNAAKYDSETRTITISYKRGDVWRYDPVSPTLAAKFYKDLLDGSPGTDVWDHLRWRPSEGAPDMRSHRAWINAVQIAGPAPDET